MLPEDNLLGSKHVGAPLNIFLYILIKSAYQTNTVLIEKCTCWCFIDY